MKMIGIAALGLIAMPVLAQDVAAPTQVSASATTGKIVMYRGLTVVGAVVGCPIRHNTTEIVELGRGKYAEWTVPPGSYTLSNKTANVDVTVGAGETKYVRCSIKMGIMAGRSKFEIVDGADFVKQQAKFERKEVNAGATAAN